MFRKKLPRENSDRDSQGSALNIKRTSQSKLPLLGSNVSDTARSLFKAQSSEGSLLTAQSSEGSLLTAQISLESAESSVDSGVSLRHIRRVQAMDDTDKNVLILERGKLRLIQNQEQKKTFEEAAPALFKYFTNIGIGEGRRFNTNDIMGRGVHFYYLVGFLEAKGHIDKDLSDDNIVRFLNHELDKEVQSDSAVESPLIATSAGVPVSRFAPLDPEGREKAKADYEKMLGSWSIEGGFGK